MALYREEQKASWMFWLLSFFVVLVFAILLYLTFTAGYDPVLTLLLVLVMLFDGFIAVAMRTFTVRIDSKLHFGFALLFRKSIAFSEIADAKAVHLSLWSGIGVHYLFAKTWVYNTRLGKGVRVERHDGRAFEFSCNEPEKVAALLQSKITNSYHRIPKHK